MSRARAAAELRPRPALATPQTHVGPHRCTGCQTVYRLRLYTCPRCQGTRMEATTMPKISRLAGSSNNGEQHTEPDQETRLLSFGSPEKLGLVRPVEQGGPIPVTGPANTEDAATLDRLGTPLTQATTEGGEPPSPTSGTDSSPSTDTPSSYDATSKPSRGSVARSTGNRSPRAATGTSSADSTAGAPTLGSAATNTPEQG